MTTRIIRRGLSIALLSTIATLSSLAGATAAAHRDRDERPWEWPLQPTPPLVEAFQPPQERWGSGHRGIDLGGNIGQSVLAVDDGVVTYAGVLAGRGVVVVSHGSLRSTYEPVTPAVARGDPVTAGQSIGLLQGVQSHCLPVACLHLGARVGHDYIDPEALLRLKQIRLKPLAGLGHDPPPLLPPL